MSLTLKIKWQRLERDGQGPTRIADEHIMFIPAEQVDVHGAPGETVTLDGWDAADYGHYVSQVVVTDGDATTTTPREGSRLVSTTDDDGHIAYWLVSEAWVLGPNGATIERVAP